MEGVRRNIALKLKPSVGKDGGRQGSPSEAARQREGKREATTDEAPPSSPSLETQTTLPSPKPRPLPLSDTTDPTTHVTSDPLPTSQTLSMATTASVSGKVPPESTIETGASLSWDQRVNLLGRAVPDPLLHMCEVCQLPILIYGRMKRCRHAFCRDCAKRAAGACPRCKESDQLFEEASMGNVYICSHGGGRYDNRGCGRSYLSQRDLEAHITYRHKDKGSLPGTAASVAPSLSSQPGLPSLTMPPFFTMPAGLPPGFPIPPMPPPNMPGTRPQPIYPARLPVMFVSQGTTATSAAVPVPPTWTTAAVFKPV